MLRIDDIHATGVISYNGSTFVKLAQPTKRGQPLRLTSFVVGAPRGASLKPTGPSRRLHNQAKPSLNARIQASERRLLLRALREAQQGT